MRMPGTLRMAVLALVPVAAGAVVAPRNLIPMRWPWSDSRELHLLEGTPVNCLLLARDAAQVARAAAAKGLVPLAVLRPGESRAALDPAFQGVVLEGDFPAAEKAPAEAGRVVVELTSKARLYGEAPAAEVAGTFEGYWPGIRIQQGGAVKAGPSGAPWIDTNAGLLRSVQARSGAMVWIDVRPPEHSVLKVERYLQAIADAAMPGGRWVIALDSDFAMRLAAGDEAARRDWARMMRMESFFEQQKAWRGLAARSKLAIVQDPADGPVLAAGMLDMISTQHTQARVVAASRLEEESLAGVKFAVAVNPQRLTAAQKQMLTTFTRGGGTLLNGPGGWRTGAALDRAESDRLNDIWREVQSMIGRRNMEVRLFNVSSILSHVVGDAAGSQTVVYLLNYSNYPVEQVTLQMADKYRRATLYSPGEAPKSLELYGTEEEGTGVDIDKVAVFAAVHLER